MPIPQALVTVWGLLPIIALFMCLILASVAVFIAHSQGLAGWLVGFASAMITYVLVLTLAPSNGGVTSRLQTDIPMASWYLGAQSWCTSCVAVLRRPSWVSFGSTDRLMKPVSPPEPVPAWSSWPCILQSAVSPSSRLG